MEISEFSLVLIKLFFYQRTANIYILWNKKNFIPADFELKKILLPV
jgi:hypothetical protein